MRRLYDLYSFNVLPWLGRTVAGDAESYRYLAESIRRHPDQEALLGADADSGSGKLPLSQPDGWHRGRAPRLPVLT